MDRQTITLKIKEIIADVADLDAEEIADDALFIDDLELDSLSLLEIGVDVDFAFKLGVSEDRLSRLRSIPETVALVEEMLATRAVAC
jgi:acyl carrier protein